MVGFRPSPFSGRDAIRRRHRGGHWRDARRNEFPTRVDRAAEPWQTDSAAGVALCALTAAFRPGRGRRADRIDISESVLRVDRQPARSSIHPARNCAHRHASENWGRVSNRVSHGVRAPLPAARAPEPEFSMSERDLAAAQRRCRDRVAGVAHAAMAPESIADRDGGSRPARWHARPPRTAASEIVRVPELTPRQIRRQCIRADTSRPYWAAIPRSFQT